ncbi:GroES-like protein [Annulohypoxylon bovei var. microspora]|nr:GroES-like protein [Annulohypoxylon bovei var. microspora]
MPKEVIVQSSLEAVEIIETPIPTPSDKEVVIKVAVAGTNPKDWKYPHWKGISMNSGDDLSGVVHSVGKDVYEFKPGDRVAAFHQCFTENGSFAEYSIAPDWMTFLIPPNVSFEEAATIPTAAVTAAVGLYIDMKLPPPFDPIKPVEGGKKMPILINGVSSAVGAFAAKFARLSGLGPIIGVAGRSSDFGKSLVDYIIDYRKGEDALVASIEDILTKEGLGTKVPYVFDAISENGSLEATLRYVDLNGGVISTVQSPQLFAIDKENFKYPDGVTAINSMAPTLFSTHKDFGYLWSRYLGRLLEDGRLKPHPYEVIPGGLKGVLTGLRNLMDGKASAVKYVYKIDDTGDIAVGLRVADVKNMRDPAGTSTHHAPPKLMDFPMP